MIKIISAFFALFLLTGHAKALVSVQEVVSDNGIKAWLIEDRTNPIISFKFSFQGGAAYDPVGKAGLARLASSTMDEGAGDLDSQAFQSRLEELSISLSFDAGIDSFSGEVMTLTQNLDEAARLLELSLTQPRFDQEAVDRIRNQIIAGLESDEEDPDRVAGKVLFKSVFGDHPYGRGSRGIIEDLETVSKEDLMTFVKERIARENLVVGVAGDIGADELKNLLDQVFSDLPMSPTNREIANQNPIFDGSLNVIEKDIVQSSILFAQEGIDRNDPDFYPAFILNYIMGGGSFSSRLYAEVREKRGLVYSVYSYLADYELGNLWIAGAATQNSRVTETLDVVRSEWQKMATEGVSVQEVENAKTFLTGSFPLRFRSSDAISGILVSMQRDNLPIDFLDTRNDQVAAVTPEDVNRVAKELMRPGNLKVVIVGMPENVQTN